ncbi:unnamed protein product [Thelazia callipaeda]|uniref:DHC_N1 domain-containing protein n=1 Tax=Thelazia callipaeda TaxID=103827 RepID=A0A0N5CM51_THECL|nr:unnamed protein product [Thelazia callipaeda]
MSAVDAKHFDEICKIEKYMHKINCNIETCRNYCMQLEAVRMIPRYSSLMSCSAEWQSKVCARIEMEIDMIISEISEYWTQIDELAKSLSSYVADVQHEHEFPFGYLQDLQEFLSYLMDEVNKWHSNDDKTKPAVLEFMKPEVTVQKAVRRCKQHLHSVLNSPTKKL